MNSVTDAADGKFLVHPLRNIFNGLRWDNRQNPSDYLITYRHRGAPGDVMQIRASEINNLGKSYFTIQNALGEEQTLIPFHRVVEIRNTKTNSIIWLSRKP